MSFWNLLEYKLANTANVTLPTTARRIRVDAWGAGGGGTVSASAEGGGGGGAFARVEREVSGGETIYFTVGAGGIAGANGGNTLASFNSDLSNPFIRAEGGKSTATQTGGAGGAASASIGDLTRSGGNGASGQGGGGTRAGSGGGSGAGPSFAGVHGYAGSAATAGASGEWNSYHRDLGDYTIWPQISSTLNFSGANIAGAISASNTHIAVLSINQPGVGGNLSISSDGVNWTSYRLPTTDTGRSLNFANGEFIVMGFNTTNGVRFHSINASVGTWRTLPLAGQAQLQGNYLESNSIAFANGFYFYANVTGVQRTANLAVLPTNVWANALIDIGSSTQKSIVAQNGNTVVFFVSTTTPTNESAIITSIDGGSTFTKSNQLYTTDFINGYQAVGIAFNKADKNFYAWSKMAAQGNNFLRLYKSSDGVNWTNSVVTNVITSNKTAILNTEPQFIVRQSGGAGDTHQGVRILDDGTIIHTGTSASLLQRTSYLSKDGVNWTLFPFPPNLDYSAVFNGKLYAPVFSARTTGVATVGSTTAGAASIGQVQSPVYNSSNADLNVVCVFDPANPPDYTSSYRSGSMISIGGSGGLSGLTGVSANARTDDMMIGGGGGGGGGLGGNAGLGANGHLRIYYTEARKILST